MTQVNAQLSTGLVGLDRVFRGLIPGDNIVWQVDSVADYTPFIAPYRTTAQQRGHKVTYFRFAKHPPLVDSDANAQIVVLHPENGLEDFVTAIHKTIEANGHGGFYIFDCLSDLAGAWFSDQMLGNFFMLTCPYLFDVEAIAYFALLRNHHSEHATIPIHDTAQVMLNVYRHKGHMYIHPLKVQQRHSPTMYMLHIWDGEEFRPVTESATICEILSSVSWPRLGSTTRRLGIWDIAFEELEQMQHALGQGSARPEDAQPLLRRLLVMCVSRDERVLKLLERHLSLSDLLDIGRRMVGTGLIGGKSVGMLLGRTILRGSDAKWAELMEPHDSFFVGSDVFYTFLVRNGIWWMREKQREPQTFLEGSERARQRVLMGTFPDYIIRQFEFLLDYFGPSPIIVRSSSLLEDNFGNAFAGKYESVFCANQGPRQKRLEDFLSAVRTIYASTMSEKALAYRAQRNMLDRDEQMALLVQRVSGALYDNLFYPQIAGVGFSFNPYVWNEKIDPHSGMLRLVFGLGTRAVNRSDDDYTRIVALNDPGLRPEENLDEVRKYAQRNVDVLDLEANQIVSCDFASVARHSQRLPLEMFASRDTELERRAAQANMPNVFPWLLTFDNLFSQTRFVQDMREMLSVLETAYGVPVDVEFTANFFDSREYKINLVQCRPLQVREGGTLGELPRVAPADIVLEAHGAVIGQSRQMDVTRIIYVVPSVYGQLPVADRYSVARLIGQVTRIRQPGRVRTTLLMGPGRWGTTTPSLGVPVSFADINNVAILCEIVAMRDDLIPDVSLGTHFFNELVEMDVLYLALFPSRKDNILNRQFLETAPNRLEDILSGSGRWSQAVRVIDLPAPNAPAIRLHADALRQKVVCYIARP